MSGRLLVWCLGIMLPLSMAACERTPPAHQQTLYMFGTLVEITLLGVEPDQAETAVGGLEQLFARMHREWHAWKPDGELYRFNQTIGNGRRLPVSDFLLPLFQQSKVLYDQSHGLFNPAIGRLIALWGFHQDERPSGPPPSAAAIAELVAQQPGMDAVQVSDGHIQSHNPAVSFDFGAYAKGYALMLAMENLRQQGVKQALLNAGGDLCALGRHRQRPWRVGVRHPQNDGVLASVDIQDECVLTSGNYERYLAHEGIRYAHIIDPRDGMPVRQIVSATVIDSDGGRADAAATALSVAGVDDWYQVARDMQLKFVMLVDEAGTVYMNPAMAERMVFDGKSPTIRLSAPL